MYSITLIRQNHRCLVSFQYSFAAHFSLKDRSRVRKTMRRSSFNENAQQRVSSTWQRRGAFWQEEALPMPPGTLLDNTYYLNFAEVLQLLATYLIRENINKRRTTQTINDTNKLFNNFLVGTLLTLPPEIYADALLASGRFDYLFP